MNLIAIKTRANEFEWSAIGCQVEDHISKSFKKSPAHKVSLNCDPFCLIFPGFNRGASVCTEKQSLGVFRTVHRLREESEPVCSACICKNNTNLHGLRI